MKDGRRAVAYKFHLVVVTRSDISYRMTPGALLQLHFSKCYVLKMITA